MIAAVGEGVTAVAIGDRVAFIDGAGAYAESIVLRPIAAATGARGALRRARPRRCHSRG